MIKIFSEGGGPPSNISGKGLLLQRTNLHVFYIEGSAVNSISCRSRELSILKGFSDTRVTICVSAVLGVVSLELQVYANVGDMSRRLLFAVADLWRAQDQPFGVRVQGLELVVL